MNEAWKGFCQAQIEKGTLRCREGVSGKELTTFGIGGTVDCVVYPQDLFTLCQTVHFLQTQQIPYCVVGRLSNLLLCEQGLRAVLVCTQDLQQIQVNGTTALAQCGVRLHRLSQTVAAQGLSGIEFLDGIPGTVGGAVYQNAGAFGRSMADCVSYSVAYDVEGNQIFTFDAASHKFAYRQSCYQAKRAVLLLAAFSLQAQPKELVANTIERHRAYRQRTQPVGAKSAGSIFLHTEGAPPPARCIEQAGLKGVRQGGAEISEKHAGFIVNRGNATAADVLDLIALCRIEVQKKYSFSMQCEIEYVEQDGTLRHP